MVVKALNRVTTISLYCKELVEANRVVDIWNYFVMTKNSPTERKKPPDTNEGCLPILWSIDNILKHDYVAVKRVIEVEVLVKLLDDEFAKEWDMGIRYMFDIISYLSASEGDRLTISAVDRMLWFQKVTLGIAT
jgi:hypothetical protein